MIGLFKHITVDVFTLKPFVNSTQFFFVLDTDEDDIRSGIVGWPGESETGFERSMRRLDREIVWV